MESIEEILSETKFPEKNIFSPFDCSGYETIDEFLLNGVQYRVFNSGLLNDEIWDDFVYSVNESCPQQFSGWAEVKRFEGWDHQRVIYVCEDRIVAGYQILIKKLPFIGKVGYLNHAPLISSTNNQFIEKFISHLNQIIKKNKFLLVIINPSVSTNEILHQLNIKYHKNIFFGLINAEAELDITAEESVLLKNMLRMRRQNLKKADNYIYKIMEGDRSDLEVFFNLMDETCKRNNVKPNPSSFELLVKIWECFSKRKLINLYKFYIEDELVTAILAFEYQDRFIPWKFGWSGKYPSLKPNDVFHWELIKIAKKKGFKKYNMGGINFSTANKLKYSQNNLTPEELKSSTFFKMGFGCYIRKLPDSLIYIPNPILSGLYRLLLCFHSLKEKYFLRKPLEKKS
uniref:Peptidoglycan bridge formation glycyltransferase FemA/FemB family protein n=1 Tax=Ignavibacterium album TaxID=591197 RepID=A0A7V2ZI99_9BACT